MKDRGRKKHLFRKHHKTIRCGFVGWWLPQIVLPYAAPSSKNKRYKKYYENAYITFPHLHSLCKQAKIMRFLHLLDEKSDFSFPPMRAAIYIIVVKKTQESWKLNLTTVYFLMKTPALPLFSKTCPQNTCFLIIACKFLMPLLFTLIQKDLISGSLIFFQPLSSAAGETPSYLVSNTAHQETTLEGEEMIGIDGWTEKNSHQLHSPQHPFILLSVLEKPHKLLFPFVFFLHPLSSRCIWYITDTLFALLPTLLAPPSAGILLNLAAACSSPAYICTCCQFPLQAKPQTLSWHLQPNNIVAFPPYTTQGMSFGFRAVGSMASSRFWPSEADSAVQTHLLLLGVACSHVQE